MTIFIDKPLFTCKERDNLPSRAMPIVYDVLSFIHLVRLNIPVILISECPKAEESFFFENGAYEYFEMPDGFRRVPYTYKIEFHPAGKQILMYEHKKHITRYRSKEQIEMSRHCHQWVVPDHWDGALTWLRANALTFKAPVLENPPTFKTVKKTKEGWVLEGFPFPMTNLDLLKIIKQKPWAYAPSPAFKGRSDSVLKAVELPFEVA